MSSSSSKPTQQLQLIPNPKNWKDRENNRLYYRQKFLSNAEKSRIEKNEKQTRIAIQVISERQKHGLFQCEENVDQALAKKKYQGYLKQKEQKEKCKATATTVSLYDTETETESTISSSDDETVVNIVNIPKIELASDVPDDWETYDL